MKSNKRLLAVLLTLAMLLCLAPVTAFAARTEEQQMTVGEKTTLSTELTAKELRAGKGSIELRAAMEVEPNTVYRLNLTNLSLSGVWDPELNIWQYNDAGDCLDNDFFMLEDQEDQSLYFVTGGDCTSIHIDLIASQEDENADIDLSCDLKVTESRWADKMIQTSKRATLSLAQEGADLNLTAFPLGSYAWQPYYSEGEDFYTCSQDDVVYVEYDGQNGSYSVWPLTAGTTDVTISVTNGEEVEQFDYTFTVVNTYTQVEPDVPATFVYTQTDSSVWGGKIAEINFPDTDTSYLVDVVYTGTAATMFLDLSYFDETADTFYDDDLYIYQELPGVGHYYTFITPKGGSTYDLEYNVVNDSTESGIDLPAAGTFTVTVTEATQATAMKFSEKQCYGYVRDQVSVDGTDCGQGYRFYREWGCFDGSQCLEPVQEGTMDLECTDLTAEDESIAVVSDQCAIKGDEDYETTTGVVPVAPGTTTLTATMENGSTASCQFTSLEPVTLTPGTVYSVDSYQADMLGEVWFKADVPETGNYRLVVLSTDDISGSSTLEWDEYNYAACNSIPNSGYWKEFGDVESQFTLSDGDELMAYAGDHTRFMILSEEDYIKYVEARLPGHNWDTDYTVDQEATCYADGMKSIHCTDSGCNVSIAQTVIPATGHDIQNGVCTRCGGKVYTCKNGKGITLSAKTIGSYDTEDSYFDIEHQEMSIYCYGSGDDAEYDYRFYETGTYTVVYDEGTDTQRIFIFVVK